MNSPYNPRRMDHAAERGSMLRTNFLDVAGLAIVFWQGTITSQDDIDALRQAVTTKLGKADVVLDFSEVKTLGSGTLAVSVCTVAYGRPAGDAPRNLQPLAGISPGAEKDSFPVGSILTQGCGLREG